ncbi:hypothetical protein ENBRE01_2306 [Enteropsectra breve]|nr:hypothetical protein ENBRE01_2306 [Enteropsectra breve]
MDISILKKAKAIFYIFVLQLCASLVASAMFLSFVYNAVGGVWTALLLFAAIAINAMNFYSEQKRIEGPQNTASDDFDLESRGNLLRPKLVPETDISNRVIEESELTEIDNIQNEQNDVQNDQNEQKEKSKLRSAYTTLDIFHSLLTLCLLSVFCYSLAAKAFNILSGNLSKPFQTFRDNEMTFLGAFGALSTLLIAANHLVSNVKYAAAGISLAGLGASVFFITTGNTSEWYSSFVDIKCPSFVSLYLPIQVLGVLHIARPYNFYTYLSFSKTSLSAVVKTGVVVAASLVSLAVSVVCRFEYSRIWLDALSVVHQITKSSGMAALTYAALDAGIPLAIFSIVAYFIILATYDSLRKVIHKIFKNDRVESLYVLGFMCFLMGVISFAEYFYNPLLNFCASAIVVLNFTTYFVLDPVMNLKRALMEKNRKLIWIAVASIFFMASLLISAITTIFVVERECQSAFTKFAEIY